MASTGRPGDEPADAGLEIADPDDYNRARRLRQIHNAREAFVAEYKDADEAVTSGEITVGRFDERVVEALIWYVVEVEPLIHGRRERERQIRERNRREAEEFGADVDEDADGGFLDPWDERPVEGPDGTSYTLGEIVENDGNVDPEDENEGVVPAVVSRRAYRVVNRFLNEVGFGLRFDQNLPGHPSETEWSL